MALAGKIFMNKLAIRNVGPIKNGISSSYLLFGSLTVFLGPQGSGKSTIAKIYSSLSWLEKAILRDELTIAECEVPGFFIDKVISYQGIQSYFKPKSFIHFIGKGCEFKFENEAFSVVKLDGNESFNMPKIMYVPAERNFLTAISGPEFIKGLPKPLHSFLAEYEDAKKWVHRQTEVALPIGRVKYRFDADSKSSILVGEGYETDLLHGSSGFQSLVPLFVVTEYLASLVLDTEDDPSREFFSVVQQRNIQEKILKLINSKSAKSDGFFNDFETTIKELVEIYNYKSFINIVEEPEQNLYPDSQRKVIYSLIKSLNTIPTNQLVLTSHSPYILNFITLSTEAYKIYSQSFLSIEKRILLERIIPEESTVDIDKVFIYELDGQGNINEIDKSGGFIDDQHALNTAFEQINEYFSKILDLE